VARVGGLKRTQNGAKETLYTLEGRAERLAETRAALKVATDALDSIRKVALRCHDYEVLGLLDKVDDPTIRREVERQAAMERVVRAARNYFPDPSPDYVQAGQELAEALADLEKHDADN
jgi:hypothetical protein